MDRIVVVGCSGSGKTTVARSLSRILDVEHAELDGLYHQPGWTHVDDDTFRNRLLSLSQIDRWVVDGNYFSHGTAELIWPLADTFVWLDPPRWRVMIQVVRRTLRRVVTREVLWNDNREPWTNLYSLNPEKNIIVWSWTRFDHYRNRYERCASDGTWAHARVYRLISRTETRNWLQTVDESRYSRPH